MNPASGCPRTRPIEKITNVRAVGRAISCGPIRVESLRSVEVTGDAQNPDARGKHRGNLHDAAMAASIEEE